MQRTDSLEKTPMLGKIEGRRRRGQQRMRWLDRITDRSLSNLREIGNESEAWHAAAHELQLARLLCPPLSPGGAGLGGVSHSVMSNSL